MPVPRGQERGNNSDQARARQGSGAGYGKERAAVMLLDESRKVSFEISCQIVAKARPRLGRGGKVYTPKKTVEYETMIAADASKRFNQPFAGPVAVAIEFYFEIAKSHSKKKRLSMIGQPHTQKPDVDNIVKSILDGLNGVAYTDDSLVFAISANKTWWPYKSGFRISVTPAW